MQENSGPLWLRVPDETVKKLDAWAKSEKRSRANLMSLLIEQAVIQWEQEQPAQPPAAAQKAKGK